ncbi:hypothetical protein Ancab_002266, partial [Ancistrocladus abbreviatus]
RERVGNSRTPNREAREQRVANTEHLNTRSETERAAIPANTEWRTEQLNREIFWSSDSIKQRTRTLNNFDLLWSTGGWSANRKAKRLRERTREAERGRPDRDESLRQRGDS